MSNVKCSSEGGDIISVTKDIVSRVAFDEYVIAPPNYL